MIKAGAITRHGVSRLSRFMAAAWLLLATLFLPIVAHASDPAPVSHQRLQPAERGIVYGLTAKELALAAAIGGVIGATTGMVQNGLSAGAAAGGVLTAVFVAHLIAELLFVGGLWYYWPEPDAPDTHGTIGPINHVTRVSGLDMAASSR